MPLYYFMNSPDAADTMETPQGITITATESAESDYTIEVSNIEALTAFAVGQQAGVDIAPFPDGADDFGVEGTLEFYGLDETPVNDAAVEESV